MIYKITNNNAQEFDDMLDFAGIKWSEVCSDEESRTVEVDVRDGYQTMWLDRGDDYEFRISFETDHIKLEERGRKYLGEERGL